MKQFIPQKYHYRLSNLKNALHGGYAQTHYAQFGEDILVSKLLPKKHGFYVDVGAHHPKRYSNTYLLHKHGWSGINIDPNPHTVQLFSKARPHDINICFGVAAKEGELLYYQFSDPAVNSFNKEEAARWMEKDWITYLGEKLVPVRPLEQILDSIPEIPSIDLLNVDTEGMDLEVLQSNNWKKYTPQVIIVESAGFDPSEPTQNEVYLFLTAFGYKLHSFMGASLIFTQPQ